MSNYSFDTNHSDENEKSENPYVPDSKETPEFVAQFIEVLDLSIFVTPVLKRRISRQRWASAYLFSTKG